MKNDRFLRFSLSQRWGTENKLNGDWLFKKNDAKVKMESGVLCVNNWCNTYIVCVQVEQVIPLPSLEEVTTYEALPSVAHPSDHIALVCDLRWNPWSLTSYHDGQRCLKTQSVRFKLCPCRFTKKNQSQQKLKGSDRRTWTTKPQHSESSCEINHSPY